MRKLFIFLLLWISIVNLNAQTADSLDISVPKFVAPILILNESINQMFFGNSFAVDTENKLFVTSYRLLASGTKIGIFIYGELYRLELHPEWTAPSKDLAIVRLIDPDNKVEFSGSILFADPPELNTEVRIWGYKIVELTSESLTFELDFVDAEVKTPYMTVNNIFLSLELTQELVFRNEYIGAPVITVDNKVIGMLVDFEENYGFAVLSSDIDALVQEVKKNLENE